MAPLPGDQEFSEREFFDDLTRSRQTCGARREWAIVARRRAAGRSGAARARRSAEHKLQRVIKAYKAGRV